MAQYFYFSVEGQTEQRYFRWLEEEINAARAGQPPVRFKIRVEKDPAAFAKAMADRGPIVIWHICDIESTDTVHLTHFTDILRRMERAEQRYAEIDYRLAYTNFTFELWMLLHRCDADRPLQSRRQYLGLLNAAYGETFQSLHHYKRRKDFERLLRKLSLSDVLNAVGRARQIEQYNRQEYLPVSCGPYRFFTQNPSLSLGECIEHILAACGLEARK